MRDTSVVAALALSNLTCGYGRTVIVRGLSLEVPAGRAVALLGPNGAGKTTLLRTISGTLPAMSGSVEIFGQDMTSWPAYRRFQSGLCHIPEGRGIFPSLTVRDNLVMQAKPGDEAGSLERAVEAFRILGGRMRQVAGTLSGGEQQMLAMARAYARDARLVLVDEASLGLAPLVIDEIFVFLEDLVRREHRSLLIVDQFARRALELSDTVYVLSRGELVFSGGTEGVTEADLFNRYLGQ